MKNKPLVAILDDDVELTNLLGCMLQELWYDVFITIDKAEFLESIDNVVPDLIVTDIVGLDMPMDGMEFLRRLKANSKYSSIPVIIFTGMQNDANLKQEALELGAFAWLKKPCAVDEFLDTLQRALLSILSLDDAGVRFKDEVIRNQSPSIVERTVTILNEHGLSTRESGILVKVARKFQSDIRIRKDGTEANAKDIIDVMSLAAERGTSLTFTFEGVDAEEAAISLVELVESQFDHGISRERRERSSDFLRIAGSLHKWAYRKEAVRFAKLAVQADPDNPYAVALLDMMRADSSWSFLSKRMRIIVSHLDALLRGFRQPSKRDDAG